jgi:hypothetical protein
MNSSLTRPSIGSEVQLYPPQPWKLDGDGEHPPIRRYTIAEWRGNEAWMTDGSIFRWSIAAGFLF